MRALTCLTLLLCSVAHAEIEVPVDVAVGPAGWWFFGPLVDNRAVPHFGLLFDVKAIIDRELIAANRDRIPEKYRGMADKVTEVRIGPSIFIPDALVISPKVPALSRDGVTGTGMFGITWRPFALTLLSTGNQKQGWDKKPRGRVDLSAGLLLTYLFVYSDSPSIPITHFVRPGIDLKLSIEVEVTKKFLISFGGGGQAYVPQKLGEFGFGALSESMCFAAFAFLNFHYRFPYKMNL